MPELRSDDPLRRDVEAVQLLSAVPAILNVVSAMTGLRFSAVARVTNDQWVACAVNDQLAFGLQPGGTLEVTTTLCAEVRDRREIVVMNHASQDPKYCNHITPKMYGFESYISVPIFRHDGSFFGTICALDPLPADLKNERTLEQLKLLAQLVGTQLDVEAAAVITRAARARLQSFVMGAPSAIAVMKGPDLVFELANQRYQAMVGGKAVIGRSARECLDPENRSSVWKTIGNVYSTGETFVSPEYQATLVGAHDQPTYLSLVVQPTFDEEAKVDGVIVFMDDVTEQLTARDSLEEKNRELDRFAYVASHDLRSPLRAIHNLAQWIEDDAAGLLPASSREHLATLRSRVDGMHSLIDGILRLARSTSSDRAITTIAVAELLKEVVDLLDLPSSVEVSFHEAAVTVVSSRTALQQVFLNLVSNAVKHAGRPDCRVRVSAKDDGERYVFSVADNGPGITKQKSDGSTGFGLSIVRKIVEKLHGKVWLESTPGQGATVHFTWPKSEPTVPTARS